MGSVETGYASVFPFKMWDNVILLNKFYCGLNKVKTFSVFLALCTSEERNQLMLHFTAMVVCEARACDWAACSHEMSILNHEYIC